MVFSENEGLLCGFDDIDLKGKLKSGNFADIYLAKIRIKDTAVAKIFKGWCDVFLLLFVDGYV